MSKIKILYIQVPDGGGSLNALYDMLKEVDKKRIEATVLCYKRNEYTKILEELTDVKVIYLDVEVIKYAFRFSSKYVNYFATQFHFIWDYFFLDRKVTSLIFGIIKQVQPVIIHHNNDVFTNRQAIKAGLKSRLIQIVHNRSLTSYKKNNLNYWVYKNLLRRCDFHIHITSAVGDHYQNLFQLDASRSIVMHDFVDMKNFTQTCPDVSIVNEFKLKEADFVMVSIGRIIEWKGQHVLIEAVNSAKKMLGNFKLLLVGPYGKGVGSAHYFNVLKERIEEYGLNDKVIFTGNRNNIAAFINTSDVVIHSAVKPEPQGLVLIEALLCNKPVIASAAGGAKEIIEKYGGYTTPVADQNKLADKLVELCKEKEHTGKINIEIYQDLLHNDFDPRKKSETLYNIYSKLII